MVSKYDIYLNYVQQNTLFASGATYTRENQLVLQNNPHITNCKACFINYLKVLSF